MSPQEYRAAREAAGVSVIQMAQLLGLTRKSIYRREMKGARVTDEMAIAQAQVLKDFAAGTPREVRPVRWKRRKPRARKIFSTPTESSPDFTFSAAAVNPTPDNPPTIP